MSPEFWTNLSGLLVLTSGTYYAILVYLGKAPGNPANWGTWSVIGAAIFFTSATPFGFNPITLSMTNPTVITLVALLQRYKEAALPTTQDIVGGSIGFLTIGAWYFADKLHASTEWILCLAILADVIPAVFIARGAWKKPQDDKPFPWLLFMLGFGISGFNKPMWSDRIVPIYMVLSASFIVVPLVWYRVRHRMSYREWF
jgi:hypothetical protein